jgi:hypothetical protein
MGSRFSFSASLYVRALRLTPMLHVIPHLLAGGLLSLQVTSTGRPNTILTLHEIANPPVLSVLLRAPESLLRNAIASPTHQHITWRRCLALPAQQHSDIYRSDQYLSL